jgi:predicted Zn finger-like uncharacterized protein
MIFSCEQCATQYTLADDKIPSHGVKVRCKKCMHVMFLKNTSVHVETGSVEDLTPLDVEPMTVEEVDTVVESIFEGAQADDGPVLLVSDVREGVPEWYVVKHEGAEHEGPFTYEHVVEQVRGGHIQSTVYVWKPGMADWEPLLAVEVFAQVCAEKKPVLDTPMHSAQTMGEEISVAWKPRSVASLSALAASALKPQEVLEHHKEVSSLHLPPVSSVPVEPFSAWSLPPPAVGARKRSKAVLWGSVVIGVFLCAAGLGLWWMQKTTAFPPAPVVAQVQAPVVSQATPPQVVAQAQPSAAVSSPPVVVQEPAHAQSSVVQEKPASVAKKVVEKPLKKALKKSIDPPAVKKQEVQAEPMAENAVEQVKEKLTKDDIWSVVKKQASSVSPCLQSAKSRGDLMPGQYKFILDWIIKPDGRVSQARLKGPVEYTETPLAACFVAAMSSWKFPASQGGAPIANFPFGPVTVR